MQKILYISLIMMIFFIIGVVVLGHWLEALPVALIGGCLGWSFTEFKRETHENR